jgi:hypothetical protein
MSEELQAAMRDASFDARPRRGVGLTFHALVVRDGYLSIACGDGMPLIDSIESARGLMDTEKCRRSGCRQAFEKDAQERTP